MVLPPEQLSIALNGAFFSRLFSANPHLMNKGHSERPQPRKLISFSRPLPLPPAGTSNLAREYDAFMQGIPLFSTVNLLINHEQPDDYRAADDTAAIDEAGPNGQPQKSANVEPDVDENLIDSDLNSGNSEPETDDDEQEANGDGQAKKTQPKRKLPLNISKLDTCTIQVYPALNPGNILNLLLFSFSKL